MPEPDAIPSDLADHVDAWWDALLRGVPPTDPLAPELTAEIRRLHAADRTAHADPAFLVRLRQELDVTPPVRLARPAAPVPTDSVRSNGRAPLEFGRPIAAVPARRQPRRPWNALATAAVVVVTVFAAATVSRLADPGLRMEGAGGTDLPSPDLLVAEGGTADAHRLVHLDPLTLADRADAPPMEVGEPAWSAVLSADGSTLVTVSQSPTLAGDPPDGPAVVTVRDGASGARRARFELPISLNGPLARLSEDGSRLVLEAIPGGYRGPSASPVPPPEWHVVETATGRTLATVASDPDGRWPTETWTDPTARRLYRLVLPSGLHQSGPGPATLVAHDLATGAEVGRLELPDLRGGTWDTGRTMPNPAVGGLPKTFPIVGELRPDGALTPDGRRLALVHADADRLTLVDLERMEVERAVTFEREQGIAERLLGLLSLAPEGVAAKLPNAGTRLNAAFAADGRHLYVWGEETEVTEDGETSHRPLPLRLIDTERGTLVAEVDRGDLNGVMPAADGSAVYAVTSLPEDPDGNDDPPMLLRRLDPLTLEVRAERAFDGYPTLLLRPSVPSGTDVRSG